MNNEFAFLKDLVSLYGVSGNEGEVREYVKKQAQPLADEITVDALGNLIAFKKGRRPGKKIMLAAHMDEVGFIITGHSDNGTLKFATVGGIDDRILPGKKVLVGKKALPGVIGFKPVHLVEKEEANKVVKIKNLYIDIGADSKNDAEKLVQRGEYACFTGEYAEMGNCIKARALDNRAGCALLLEILKNRYDFDLYCCFTVQEEVGLRGAQAASWRIAPDLAIIVETTTCGDVAGVEKHEYSTELGKGPALTVMDRTTISDRGLVEFIRNVAERENILFQFKKGAAGGNDAGAVQRSRSGVKVASVSVPCRYIHSPVNMMHREDFMNCKKLLEAVLSRIDREPEVFGKFINGGMGL